jgi:hypothetical protein
MRSGGDLQQRRDRRLRWSGHRGENQRLEVHPQLIVGRKGLKQCRRILLPSWEDGTLETRSCGVYSDDHSKKANKRHRNGLKLSKFVFKNRIRRVG